MKTIRTFLAIALPREIASAAARRISKCKQAGDAIKWVPAENLHLTLKFLGEVDNTDVPRVCDCLQRICEGFDPFPLHIGGNSGLPSIDRARVLCVTVEDPESQLIAMVGQIERAFAELGFKPEARDYQPHLTLGRTRGGSRRASDEVIERWREHEDETIGDMIARRVEVVGSFLEKRGPSYQIMHTVDL
ncbi:MAG: RNA 2',3'-cyclic phosphodiesterase [Planctomycetota bacterium]